MHVLVNTGVDFLRAAELRDFSSYRVTYYGLTVVGRYSVSFENVEVTRYMSESCTVF